MYTSCLPASKCGRLVADALKDNLAELREDDETKMSQYVHTELSEVARINIVLS